MMKRAAMMGSMIAALGVTGTVRAQELPPPPAAEIEVELVLPAPPPAELSLSAELAPPVPGYAETESDPIAPASRPLVDDTDDADDADLTAVFFGGLLGYAVGSAAGIGLMVAMLEDDDPAASLLVGIPLGVLIAGTGLAAGATIGGDLSGGNGTFGYTFAGQALGGAASLLVLLGTQDGAIGLGSMIVLPLLGGTLGYTLSDHTRDPSRAPRWTASVAPALDGRGGMASVGATF
jgi:hypothetical protein